MMKLNTIIITSVLFQKNRITITLITVMVGKEIGEIPNNFDD